MNDTQRQKLQWTKVNRAPMQSFFLTPPSPPCFRGRKSFYFTGPLRYSHLYLLKPAPPNISSCFFEKKNNDNFSKELSVLSLECPWDAGNTWSTMALYFFSFHIPLSFGGLSVMAQILHQPLLHPQTQVLSLLFLQTTELMGAVTLLQYMAKPQYKLIEFFLGKKSVGRRNWLLASALGFGFLLLMVAVTSLLAERLVGPKDVNNPALKEILSSGLVSEAACFFIYCFITPILEEIVYRGFLLTSLAASIGWRRAVVSSACIFTAAHLSWVNSPQLFLVGCILGCSYCYTGNLATSFIIHAAYNAATLLMTIAS